MTEGPSRDEPAPRRRPPIAAIGALALVAAAGLTILVVALGSSGGSKTTSDQAGADLPTFNAGLAAAPVTTLPTPQATIDLSRAPAPAEAVQNLSAVSAGDRFVIAQFGIDAPLTYRQVGKDGQMPNPEGPDDVAYYDFSLWPGMGGGPGKGGNAVFAGHVDSGSKPCKNGTVKPPCQAVLWDLNRLRLGDEIEVRVSGQSYKYRVASNQHVSATTGPWDQIVSATAVESLTIITCAGNFNRETGGYTDRQVVTAVKV